jgi:aspartate ammonia-lyase
MNQSATYQRASTTVGPTRTERDALGEYEVPQSALYGIQTARALENFPVSGLLPLPIFVDTMVWIKRSAARVHRATGRLDASMADAIVAAADEVLAGAHRDQFVVDPYQAGAGTSHNMNVNEVLANRANELLKSARGTYDPVHPNDHVNMAQSTNDTIPTAIRLGVLATTPGLLESADTLAEVLADRADAFAEVLKAGRTHLQDATPIRLGQEFAAFADTVRGHRRRVGDAAEALRELPIGGTAVGTGLNAEPEYASMMITELSSVSGMTLVEGRNKVQLMQSMGAVTAFSGTLRTLAMDLGKIANDIRLLASGPRTGLAELHLPAVQPGSSIMPGKVNPVLAEMTNMVCYQVIGNDLAIASAAGAGQLELNVMMPVIAHNTFFSIGILENAIRVFTERCIRGIEADEAQCANWLERSTALITALAPRLGYAEAAKLAKDALEQGVTVRELVEERGLLTPTEKDAILDLRAMTEPGVPGGASERETTS